MASAMMICVSFARPPSEQTGTYMPVFLIVTVAFRNHRHERRCLAAADAFLFARDADRPAADADLDKIKLRFL